MKSALFIELMRFASAKKTARERLRYVVLSLIFYPFLARTISAGAKHGDAASNSQVGDDIYPLF